MVRVSKSIGDRERALALATAKARMTPEEQAAFDFLLVNLPITRIHEFIPSGQKL